MKSFLLTTTIALLVAACTKTDVTPIVDASDPDWIRLSVPSDGEALTVTGSLDSTLFVATVFKVYRTTDQGRSWTLVRNSNLGPNGVLLRNDTLYLLTNRGGTNTTKVASNAVEYSLNSGQTWQRYYPRSADGPNLVLNRVNTSNGTSYLIKDNSTPVPGNEGTAYVNPSTLLKQTGNVTTEVAFPFRHIVNAIHLDSRNRLYVAVSGEHIPETNRIYCCDREKPSYVYVSKRSLP